MAEAPASSSSTAAAGTQSNSDTVQVVLKNTKAQGTLYAHITGRDNNGLFILGADGQSPYRPGSPSKELQPLAQDTGIVVGGPGESRTVTVPRIFGARLWFSRETPLEFFLNPGPALVEPSATNTSDANYGKDWGFCEFTYNESQIYVNVSYVDFVSLPIALQLENQVGTVRRVDGMPADGLARVADGLEAQGRRDGQGWEKLVIREGGHVLRALSPNSAGVLFPDLFRDYYKGHVDAVWDKYRGENLTVNTQFTWGDVRGRVGDDGKLTFSDNPGLGFDKPTARDIFSCSTGPFAAGEGVTDERLNIGARLAAALNRSTLLTNSRQPEGEDAATYYKDAVTNHYSRVCHETTIESRGYAFPYDDVGSSQGADQSGFLNDGDPKVLTVEVGGK
ncbi:putative glucan endo-1,3-beta-glucosidase precursor [Emericellopsis atlantica]|uniref:Glucan endo-1,3-beta-glucosidase n=1 Tax=Emericellopsis atlantica TaxID=2614577 RepID=A0A9P7ZP82_9HYPO|nr:putative glucan endo-1,3-beta-glucosidase precursor [Emericellopsis atlantica]KAG9255200.1 putative glucan endo-1,3-beta-glucosidase precursor [Emericellopsis atlantica]